MWLPLGLVGGYSCSLPGQALDALAERHMPGHMASFLGELPQRENRLQVDPAVIEI
jgi:hypothetical protein